ncbi:hypothetical protein ANPL_04405 [Anaplasma platys]|uniref:Uncharacterized protein n=2 Tax=Anaplasma platys TaxID=949 RepID=A0A858PZD9_9RICK|nr:hypothetical protein ANPL_04405 [Anaplasma platys]
MQRKKTATPKVLVFSIQLKRSQMRATASSLSKVVLASGETYGKSDASGAQHPVEEKSEAATASSLTEQEMQSSDHSQQEIEERDTESHGADIAR